MYLVFDIGATNMRIATSIDEQTINEPQIVNTPQSFSEGIKLFSEIAQDLTRGAKIDKCAGGIAGSLNKEKTEIFLNSKILDWNQKPLVEELQKAINAPVLLENDADLGGLGEAIAGAGKDQNIVAFLTISTGVGGVRIVNKRIDQNSLGFEPGHQIINNGESLEQLISGFYLEKKHNKKPEEITEQKIWADIEKNLAIGLNNITVLWSPDIIVLGGSLMNSINIKNVEKHLKKVLQVFPEPPKLAKATLGNTSGLYGALSLISSKK